MSDQVPVAPFETRSGPFVLATAPAIGRTESEDMAGISEDQTAWVLDGADDPLADETKCSHGATWYVRTLHQAITQSLSDDQPSLQVVLQRAIQYVRQRHEADCEHFSHRKPSAAVAILHWGLESIDYLVLGDASIVLESSEHTIHVTDRRMHRIARDLRQVIVDRLRQGRGYNDPQRTTLLKELVAQEQLARNTPSGYSIAAYDPKAALDAVTGSFQIGSSEPTIDRAALLSDGAERVISPFGLCANWRDFMKLMSTQGPAACIRRIRDAELLDRAGQDYPRTKFSDDASIVLWTRSKHEDVSSSNAAIA